MKNQIFPHPCFHLLSVLLSLVFLMCMKWLWFAFPWWSVWLVSCICFLGSMYLNPLPTFSQFAHLLRNTVLIVQVCGCQDEHVVVNGQLLRVGSHLYLVERQGLSFMLLRCIHNPHTSRWLSCLHLSLCQRKAGITDVCLHILFFPWVLGTELRSPGLCS